MYPVSPEFSSEIAAGAEIITRGDIYRGKEDPVLEDVPILSGVINEDPYADVRRRCSIVLGASEDLDKYVPNHSFRDDVGTWPAGNEVRIRQGVKYNDTRLGTEWVELGYFTIGKVSVDKDRDDTTVSIDGFDLSRRIGRAKLTDSFDIPEGTRLTDAVFSLIYSQCPWLDGSQFDASLVQILGGFNSWTDLRTPHIVLERGTNPWVYASKLCNTQGIDLRVDGNKKIILRPMPNQYVNDPVATYHTGQFNIIEKYERVLDDQDAINGVIVIGENSSNVTVARGEVWDRDINSPTYYDPANPSASVYGPNPITVVDQNISSNQAAEWMAYFTFLNQRGILETVTVSALPHFAHEPFDQISLKDSDAGVDGMYLIQTTAIGLGPQGTLEAMMVSREWFE